MIIYNKRELLPVPGWPLYQALAELSISRLLNKDSKQKDADSFEEYFFWVKVRFHCANIIDYASESTR